MTPLLLALIAIGLASLGYALGRAHAAFLEPRAWQKSHAEILASQNRAEAAYYAAKQRAEEGIALLGGTCPRCLRRDAEMARVPVDVPPNLLPPYDPRFVKDVRRP